MSGRDLQGFAIIETSLFSAISSLLFVGISLAVQRERYSDSVQSTLSFLQKQFNDTLNVVNDRGRIRTLRQETGLTQEEVAHRADLHWSYIGQIERATTNPTYLSLIKLAKGLGVEPAT